MSYIPDHPFGGGPLEGEREELDDPYFLSWTSEEVGNWIEASGYASYRDCFERNEITGRRLINIDASVLPKIGIRDFNHIRDIAKRIRDLLEIEEPVWNRSISLPPRDKLASFLECKSGKGTKADALTYGDFVDQWETMKFQPPLDNQGLLIASCKVEDCGDIVYGKRDENSCV